MNRSLKRWTMVMFQSQSGGFAALLGGLGLQAVRNSWWRAEFTPARLGLRSSRDRSLFSYDAIRPPFLADTIG